MIAWRRIVYNLLVHSVAFYGLAHLERDSEVVWLCDRMMWFGRGPKVKEIRCVVLL